VGANENATTLAIGRPAAKIAYTLGDLEDLGIMSRTQALFGKPRWTSYASKNWAQNYRPARGSRSLAAKFAGEERREPTAPGAGIAALGKAIDELTRSHPLFINSLRSNSSNLKSVPFCSKIPIQA